MASTTNVIAVSKPALWTGWILSGLIVAFLTLDGVMKLVKPGFVIEATTRLGYPEDVIVGIGVVLLCCTIAYAVPRTSVLGAILLTGYLGGATASHVRMGDPWYAPIVFGVILWLGLLLRDARLRQLLPLVSIRRYGE
jgi:hypothetical protein